MQNNGNASSPNSAPCNPVVPAFCDLISTSQEYSRSILEGDPSHRALPLDLSRGSDSSSDDGFLKDQEKLDRLQAQIRKLEKDLHDERLKNKGFSVLSQCTQEEQAENKKLRAQNAKLKSHILKLQRHLQSTGASEQVSLLSFSDSTSNSDSLPSISQEAFDNLVRDNALLKQKVRSMEMDTSSSPNHHSREADLQRRIQTLQTQVSSLREQLIQEQTSHNAEVQHLRQQIQALQSGRSSPAGGAGFAEERAGLQRKVKELTDTLHRFSASLQVQDGTAATVANQQTMEGSMQKISLAPSVSGGSKSENEALMNEIYRLNDRLKELVTMNTRWQEHSTLREEFVEDLQRKLKEMEGKLMEARKVQISEEQQKRIDELIQQHKRKVGLVEEEKVKIEDENRQLRQEMEQHRQTIRSQEQAIASLQSQVGALQGSANHRQGSASSQEDKEIIDMLKAQIQICTEDFQSERRDRERAHQKLSEVERELAITKKKKVPTATLR